MREGESEEGLADVAEFGRGALHEFSARWSVVEEIADFGGGADVAGGGLGNGDVADAVDEGDGELLDRFTRHAAEYTRWSGGLNTEARRDGEATEELGGLATDGAQMRTDEEADFEFLIRF